MGFAVRAVYTGAGLSNVWNVSFEGLENVSGTATYSTELQVSSFKYRVSLFLSEVCDVATVTVNGEEAGCRLIGTACAALFSAIGQTVIPMMEIAVPASRRQIDRKNTQADI